MKRTQQVHNNGGRTILSKWPLLSVLIKENSSKEIAQKENQNAFFQKIKDGSGLIYLKLFHSSGESGLV